MRAAAGAHTIWCRDLRALNPASRNALRLLGPASLLDHRRRRRVEGTVTDRCRKAVKILVESRIDPRPIPRSKYCKSFGPFVQIEPATALIFILKECKPSSMGIEHVMVTRLGRRLLAWIWYEPPLPTNSPTRDRDLYSIAASHFSSPSFSKQ